MSKVILTVKVEGYCQPPSADFTGDLSVQGSLCQGIDWIEDFKFRTTVPLDPGGGSRDECNAAIGAYRASAFVAEKRGLEIISIVPLNELQETPLFKTWSQKFLCMLG